MWHPEEQRVDKGCGAQRPLFADESANQDKARVDELEQPRNTITPSVLQTETGVRLLPIMSHEMRLHLLEKDGELFGAPLVKHSGRCPNAPPICTRVREHGFLELVNEFDITVEDVCKPILGVLGIAPTCTPAIIASFL